MTDNNKPYGLSDAIQRDLDLDFDSEFSRLFSPPPSLISTTLVGGRLYTLRSNFKVIEGTAYAKICGRGEVLVSSDGIAKPFDDDVKVYEVAKDESLITNVNWSILVMATAGTIIETDKATDVKPITSEVIVAGHIDTFKIYFEDRDNDKKSGKKGSKKCGKKGSKKVSRSK